MATNRRTATIARSPIANPIGTTQVDGPACCASVRESPLAESDAAEYASAFGALSDPSRLRLLSLIATAPEGEVCVCDLVEPIGRSQPTVSHHLKVLAEAGIVVGERRGRWAWYRVVPERLEQLRSVLA